MIGWKLRLLAVLMAMVSVGLDPLWAQASLALGAALLWGVSLVIHPRI